VRPSPIDAKAVFLQASLEGAQPKICGDRRHLSETKSRCARQLDMRTFYALNVHRKDGSWHRHLMAGAELPESKLK
jgi:hypothetical protein